jgi:hypothetical protein
MHSNRIYFNRKIQGKVNLVQACKFSIAILINFLSFFIDLFKFANLNDPIKTNKKENLKFFVLV